ncbi:MAG TPA: MazG nucleotide pyrophosphohydrolase domain-containing protein [candidate division Zixibacteria bacterium]|nr:MazG nucleotide pyrophosphohydrolase domain-containing protein [candidate division Zixibacteria bacterium]
MKNLEEICLEIDALISQLGGYWSEEWLIQPVIEELGEFSKELQIKAGLHPLKHTSLEKIEEEFGDLLFAVLAMGRGLNINIEHALMTSIKKYDKRSKRE